MYSTDELIDRIRELESNQTELKPTNRGNEYRCNLEPADSIQAVTGDGNTSVIIDVVKGTGCENCDSSVSVSLYLGIEDTKHLIEDLMYQLGKVTENVQ